MISRLWAQWRTALVIVKPEAILGWQPKWFDAIGVGRAERGSRVDLAAARRYES
jgi:hypothetical protein